MNLYPAIKCKMGRWVFFLVKMTMREIADNVRFASDVNEDRTLDEAIQRVLNESRVKRDLVAYLTRQQDRFFSSIVVAALEGSPKWYAVSIADDERFEIFRSDERLNSTFGILRFDGTQKYYALDGQHRLAAVKALLDPRSDTARDAPPGFEKEEISVLVVVPQEAESREDFLKRYRRLFGNLNRYAKPMDQVTNIIMDEDDAFAIVTRRLITDHVFFKAPGRQRENPKVKTEKGKNLKRQDTYFTSLETLYELNQTLLSSNARRTKGWDESGIATDQFKKFRPDDTLLDTLTEELTLYWNGLLDVLPDLKSDPTKMRVHEADPPTDDARDSALFWPIGQEIMAEIARDLLDRYQDAGPKPTAPAVKRALSKLKKIDWEMHDLPWRYLILVPDGENWRIRNEDRKEAVKIATRIIRWQIGLDRLDRPGIDNLQAAWHNLLYGIDREQDISRLWGDLQGRAKE
jgi:DNA sulfur modification protein DndB